MVLSFKLYINSINQNEVLIYFIKSFFNNLLLLDKKASLYFNRIKNVSSPNLNIRIYTTLKDSHIKLLLKKEWSCYLKKNKHLTNNLISEIDSLFINLPQGELKIINNSNNNQSSDGYAENSVSITNLNILEEMYIIKEEEEGITLKAFLVFLYSLGGYSSFKIFEICNYLLNTLNFSKHDTKQLTNHVESIINEELSFLLNLFKHTFSELQLYTSINSNSSSISKWKYSYGILIKDFNSESNQASFYLSLFKNQLDLSDSDCYIFLLILKKISIM